MSRLIRTGLAAVALSLLGLVGPARAAEWKTAPPKSHAVIVGVGQFSDKQIKPAPTCDEDAKALYDLFTNPKIGGIDPAHVHLLTSAVDEKRHGVVGTKEAILKTIKDVTAQAGKDELVYLMLIGQGGANGSQGCMFAADSTFKDRAKSAIFAFDFEPAMKGIKSQLCTVFDINFKGFEAPEEKALNPQIKDFQDAFLGSIKDADEDSLKDGRVMIYHGRNLSETIVSGKLSLFAKVMIDALTGAADTTGYEPDGLVTLDEFSKYLSKEFAVEASKLGKEKEQKAQFALVFAGADTHFVMTRNPAVYPKVEERLKKLETLVADKKVEGDVAVEAKKYLSRMPKLKALQELRKLYIGLVEGTASKDAVVAERSKILEGMKLDRRDAESYAETVLSGIYQVRVRFIKETKEEDLIANAIKGLYQRSEEVMGTDLAERLKGIAALRPSQRIELLADARQPLGKREDLDDTKDSDASFQAFTAKLGDPYTTYWNRERVAEFDKQTNGNFSGIGVVIRADLNKDALRVVTPIKGSPAYKAGIRTGDLITRVRREVDREGKATLKPEEKDISTKGMDTADAVKIITGQPGSKVTVVIEREGEKEPIPFEITRNRVEVESVLGYKRKADDNWDYYIDPESKIAYIYVTQFTRRSADDVERVVQKLDAENVKGLIIDLRFNPGGLLNVVADMASLFLEDGLVVSVKPRVGLGETFKAERLRERKKVYTRFPIACLINGESASASEILSACLQDHGRAVIMGERSYGKGSVQNVVPFPRTGGEFKVTIATYWRPSGKNINKSSTKGTPEEEWGVMPDSQYELKLPPQETGELFERLVNDWSVIPVRGAKAKEEKKPFADRQLDMALQYLKSQIKAANETPLKKAG